MKACFLSLVLCGAALLTGCETVAVVDHSPYYSPGVVYYDSGRPYYYTSGVRYWGYPRGYTGSRVNYTHVDVDREVTRNYYVDRRTVYHGDQVDRHHHQVDQHHPRTSAATNVKVQPKQTTVKKKKVYRDDA